MAAAIGEAGIGSAEIEDIYIEQPIGSSRGQLALQARR
jgi:hypothetical protein